MCNRTAERSKTLSLIEWQKPKLDRTRLSEKKMQEKTEST